MRFRPMFYAVLVCTVSVVQMVHGGGEDIDQ